MSRYYSFNDFMTDVLERADNVCQDRHQVGLEDLYSVSSDTMRTVKKLIESGWYVFAAVVALFAVGSVGLVAAATTFLTTPVGWIVVAVLGISALRKIQEMYHDRILPNAVRDVGEAYKAQWEAVEGDCPAIDRLVNEAAVELVEKAEKAKF